MIFVSTKEITIRKFLLPLIIKYLNEYNNAIIICNDSSKLKDLNELRKYKKVKYYDVNFPIIIKDIINPYKLIKIILKLRKILNLHNTKIITNTPIASHIVRIALLFQKRKIIYFVHGFRFYNFRKLFHYLIFFGIELLLSIKVHSYITINTNDFKFSEKIFRKKSILVNGVGLDLNKLKKFDNKLKFINQNPIKILVIGAYKLEKGYMDVVNLLNKSESNNLMISCFGYGNYNKFKQKIRKEKINYIKFNNFSENIYSEYCNNHILLVPSRREGLSVTIMEGMFIGIPIIATNVRGCKDLINNNINGYTYQPGDIKKIELILKDYKKNYNKVQNLIKNAKYDAIKKFDSKIISNQIIQFINNDY